MSKKVYIGPEEIVAKHESRFEYIQEGDFVRKIYNKDNIMIGAFSASVEDYVLDVEYFEIYEEFQRKGYGRATIENVRRFIPNISLIKGTASEDAESFWVSVNADFHDSCSECTYEQCVYNPNCNGMDISDDSVCDDFTDKLFELRV